MPRKVTLNRSEIVLLDLQDPATENRQLNRQLKTKGDFSH